MILLFFSNESIMTEWFESRKTATKLIKVLIVLNISVMIEKKFGMIFKDNLISRLRNAKLYVEGEMPLPMQYLAGDGRKGDGDAECFGWPGPLVTMKLKKTNI